MKKTVIAAALASTVFSGAAMAWTAGGTGGNIEIGGNIQVTPYTTPWEVEVGAPAATLDANITKGTKVVMIPVTKAIPVLGIRSKTATFVGAPTINPQIDYRGAVQINNFSNGVTTMTLPVMDADNPATQIGALETKFSAAAVSAYYVLNADDGAQYSTYSDTASSAFYGGVATKIGSVIQDVADAKALLNNLNTQYLANYAVRPSTRSEAPMRAGFVNPKQTYAGAYGAGIQAGQNIKLTLTKPAANDVIKWKASLPVTVSYQ